MPRRCQPALATPLSPSECREPAGRSPSQALRATSSGSGEGAPRRQATGPAQRGPGPRRALCGHDRPAQPKECPRATPVPHPPGEHLRNVPRHQGCAVITAIRTTSTHPRCNDPPSPAVTRTSQNTNYPDQMPFQCLDEGSPRALSNFAPFSSSPLRCAPVRFAFVRFAPVRSAPVK